MEYCRKHPPVCRLEDVDDLIDDLAQALEQTMRWGNIYRKPQLSFHKGHLA